MFSAKSDPNLVHALKIHRATGGRRLSAELGLAPAGHDPVGLARAALLRRQARLDASPLSVVLEVPDSAPSEVPDLPDTATVPSTPSEPSEQPPSEPPTTVPDEPAQPADPTPDEEIPDPGPEHETAS